MTVPRRRYALAMPLVVLAVGTLVAWLTDVDMRVAHWFFDPQTRDWPLAKLTPFVLSNRYGQLIGWIPALLGIGVICGSIWKRELVHLRKPALFVILLLALGPGLLVNLVFKDNWGRPRPVQVEDFGGDFHYRPPFLKDENFHMRRSFPSGHAAMGFFFMAPYFILLARRRRAALAWLFGGVGFGLFVGLGRMAAGKHWASDILWSFGMVYLLAYVLARWMKFDRPDSQSLVLQPAVVGPRSVNPGHGPSTGDAAIAGVPTRLAAKTCQK